MQRPSLFIGSSHEGLDVARDVRGQLKDIAQVTLWSEGVFGLGQGTLEALVEVLDRFDFAVLILTPDDMIESRGEASQSPRDNVLLECGLFMGHIGRHRTFVVYDSDRPIKIPSDLAGITVATFNGDRTDKNQLAAVGEACDPMRRAILQHGQRAKQTQTVSPTHHSRRIDEVLDRGSPRFLEMLVDGALYVADTSATFHEGLKKAIVSGNVLPMKYLYCTDDGCEFWLDICRKPEYRFYTHSLSLLGARVNDIVACLKRKSDEDEFDLVSLGSGNGEKDNRLLRELCSELPDTRQIYYYPIDINSQMLVQAVRGAMIGVRRDRVCLKAIVGDISQVHQLVPVYEDRPAPNIFSVLGNTIGNSDERNVLRAIRLAMLPGDFLLAEVNIRSDSLEDFLTDDLNMRHDFVPLQSLGLELQAHRMRYERVENISVVPGTVSTLACYKDITIAERVIGEVKLSVIHHYKPDQFSKYVRSELGLELIGEWRHEDAAIFLFHRGGEAR